MIHLYQFFTIWRIRFQRWKFRKFRHDGAYTRTLQREAARGKGWSS